MFKAFWLPTFLFVMCWCSRASPDCFRSSVRICFGNKFRKFLIASTKLCSFIDYAINNPVGCPHVRTNQLIFVISTHTRFYLTSCFTFIQCCVMCRIRKKNTGIHFSSDCFMNNWRKNFLCSMLGANSSLNCAWWSESMTVNNLESKLFLWCDVRKITITKLMERSLRSELFRLAQLMMSICFIFYWQPQKFSPFSVNKYCAPSRKCGGKIKDYDLTVNYANRNVWNLFINKSLDCCGLHN